MCKIEKVNILKKDRELVNPNSDYIIKVQFIMTNHYRE